MCGSVCSKTTSLTQPTASMKQDHVGRTTEYFLMTKRLSCIVFWVIHTVIGANKSNSQVCVKNSNNNQYRYLDVLTDSGGLVNPNWI